MDAVKGRRPKSKESTLEDWKDYVRTFPKKLKQIVICGGEPTLVSYLADLVNWILDEGYHCYVLTNLYKPEAFDGIKNSYRFKIQATYHHCSSRVDFLVAYRRLIFERYRVDVDEIDDGLPKELDFSKLKPCYGIEYLKQPVDAVSPDLHFYENCYLIFENGSSRSH